MTSGRHSARDIRYGRRGGRWADPTGDPRTGAEIQAEADAHRKPVQPDPPSLFDVALRLPVSPPDAPYRHVAPSHPDTAQQMQRRALPRSGTFKAAMYAAVAEAGLDGMSDYDLEDRFGRSHQSTSGCRNALMNDGWIAAARNTDGTPATRTNRFGNEATVWVAATQGA